VFAGYTAKQWGVPIEQVDAATINRVPVRTGYDDRYFTDSIQMMPSRGYAHLFAELLSHKNITTALNTDSKDKLRFDLVHKKIFFNGAAFKGVVFFTGAVDELLDYRYGRLPYRSLNLVFETHERAWYQPNAVVNYPGEEPWTRITEFKHFTAPEQDETQHTVVLKEYPVPYSPEADLEPFYPIISEDNRNLYEQYERDLRVFTNLRLCGRLAEYKYYNMDDVVARALEIAGEISVNTRARLPVSLIREVFVYGVIGAGCAALDSAVFMLLRMTGINLYAANFASINLGIFASFLLNTFVNFKVKDKLPSRGIKFFAVGYTGLALSMLIMRVGVEVLHAEELAVKLVSVVIVAAVQFTLNKLFTFRKGQT
jgi:putative flippase GtrA